MNRPGEMGNKMDKAALVTYKLEVMQVVGVDIGRGVDLQGVVILVGVLKQAVHWIQDLGSNGYILHCVSVKV